MTESRLVRILWAFTGEELALLRQFIQSPMFNNGKRPKKTQLLLEEIARWHPVADRAGLEKEQVYQAVFPGEGYQERKLDKVASDLMQVVRQFIQVNEALNLPAPDQWLVQASFFRRKGLVGEFRHAINQAEKWQREAPIKEEEHFFTIFRLEVERMRDAINTNDNKDDLNLPAVIRSLDVYYVLSKMIYCAHFLTKGNHTSLKSSTPFILFEEVLKEVEKNFLDIPIVAVYYHTCRLLLKREEQEGYNKLKSLVKEGRYSVGLLRATHSILRNYASQQYNQGHQAYLAELFQMLKDHDAQGTLLQDTGTILDSTLQNAVTVALKMGETDWAIRFLNRHRQLMVGADDADALYSFNLANCHFHQGDFKTAESHLFKYHYRSVIYKLAARRLEIKLYYETSSPLLDARLDAFKIFVHEQKSILPPGIIAPNNHFIDLMRQLLAPKTLGNSGRVGKLLEKMSAQKAVAEREWLQEKMASLMR